MKRRDLVDFLMLAALWGAAFMFTRVAVPQFGIFPLMGLRTAIGALVLVPLALAAGGGAQMRSHAGRIAWVGLLGAGLPFVMLGYAMQHQTAGFTAILNATVPFWAAIVGFLWLGERLAGARWLGLAIGFFGIVVLVWGRASFDVGGLGLPILATLVATLSYGTSSCATRKMLGGVRPLTGAAGSQLFAALMLLPFAVASWPQQSPDLKAWLSAIVLGVFCTGFAFVLFFRLVGSIGSTHTMAVNFLVPVFGVLWGALLLGEAITLQMVAGAAVILGGTALVMGFIAAGRRTH